MSDVSSSAPTIAYYTQEIEQTCTNPMLATNALRQLASHVRQLHRATVFYRFLLGRQLVGIKQNQLWSQMERRDYRSDPNGIPLWGKNEKERFHASWYNFIDQGFGYITGLHRETAYSAIKLAESTALSTLPLKELQSFTRLANALEIVRAERRGLKISSELIHEAHDMPMRQFRQTMEAPVGGTQRSKEGSKWSDANGSGRSEQSLVMKGIIGFFKTAAARNGEAVNNFWAVLQRAMLSVNQDPGEALESITKAYCRSGT